MLIRVLHVSGSYDYVKPHVLDELLKDNGLISFYRSDGPVVLGIHPVRADVSREFSGEERRGVEVVQ